MNEQYNSNKIKKLDDIGNESTSPIQTTPERKNNYSLSKRVVKSVAGGALGLYLALGAPSCGPKYIELSNGEHVNTSGMVEEGIRVSRMKFIREKKSDSNKPILIFEYKGNIYPIELYSTIEEHQRFIKRMEEERMKNPNSGEPFIHGGMK